MALTELATPPFESLVDKDIIARMTEEGLRDGISIVDNLVVVEFLDAAHEELTGGRVPEPRIPQLMSDLASSRVLNAVMARRLTTPLHYIDGTRIIGNQFYPAPTTARLITDLHEAFLATEVVGSKLQTARLAPRVLYYDKKLPTKKNSENEDFVLPAHIDAVGKYLQFLLTTHGEAPFYYSPHGLEDPTADFPAGHFKEEPLMRVVRLGTGVLMRCNDPEAAVELMAHTIGYPINEDGIRTALYMTYDAL